MVQTWVGSLAFKDALRSALEISSDFEGHQGFASSVGNFDGQGLTCGALGFTWGFGTQQKMILQCEQSNPGVLLKRMPTLGSRYLQLASLPIAQTMAEVSSWSDHPGSASIQKQYRDELGNFWGCPEMISIQVSRASGIGLKAYQDAQLWIKARGTTTVTLREFCYFFDVRVMNGSLKGLSYSDVTKTITTKGGKDAVIQSILQWCSTRTADQMAYQDSIRNGKYWAAIVPQMTPMESDLLVLGFLRSQMANPKFQPATMNRRGILSFWSGFTEGELKILEKQYPNYDQPIAPQ